MALPSKTRSSLTQSEACAFEIMALIRNGEYPPGTKLSEYSLAERLQYGLSPVKMALNSLAEGGILQRRSRSGTYVRNVSREEYLNLLEIRVRLEGLAAFQATTRLTPRQLSRLDKLACELDGFAGTDDVGRNLEYIRKDTDFHMAVAEASENHFLVEVLERQHLLHLCFLYGVQVTPDPTPQQLAGTRHTDIIEAFREKDPVKADQLMQRHIGRIREFLV